MSTHNICFRGEIRKNITNLQLKKAPYLERGHYHEKTYFMKKTKCSLDCVFADYILKLYLILS